MACDATFPSTITCMTLFFFFSLLLAFHFSMAVQEHTLTSSTKDDAKKVATLAKEGSRQNFKTNIKPNQSTKGIHVHDLQKGIKGRNKIFNASDHEVPSGPNPISNR